MTTLRRRRAAAQPERSSPEVPIVNKRKNRCHCHVSCHFSYDAQTCDDRYGAAPVHRLNDEVECASRRTRPGQCLPGGAATLPPQSSLPGQWRRRRNSLLVVKSVHKRKMQPLCVLRAQLTTATQAIMIPTKSSSATSSVCSFAASSMALKYTAQPSCTGRCNGTQKIQNKCVQSSKKELVQAKAARAEEFPSFLFTSIGVHEAIAASQKANLSLPRNVSPPRSNAHDVEAIGLPQETSDFK